MENSGLCCSAFCAIATAVYIFTVAKQVKEGYYATCCAFALGVVGSLLYFWGSPGFCGLLLLCGSLSLHYVTPGRKKEQLSMHGRAVLITGCDTGFGHALAKLLSEMGMTVFAGVLDVNGPGAHELRQHGSAALQVLQLDVTDHSQIEQAHQYIHAQVGEAGLWGLVNNAGILGCAADGEIQPITAFRRCMDVNFLSAVKMCQVFLPLLRRSKGRIVNVSSMAGEVPMPMFSAYASSKAALSHFSRVMRLELAKWNVKVAIMQPTAFRTNILGNTENWHRYQKDILKGLSSDTKKDYGEAYVSSLLENLCKMSSKSSDDLRPVLEDMCHALMASDPKPLYTTGQTAWFLPLFHRLCPTDESLSSRCWGHEHIFKSELNPHGNESFVTAKTKSQVFPMEGHEMWLGQFFMPRPPRHKCHRAFGLKEFQVEPSDLGSTQHTVHWLKSMTGVYREHQDQDI